MAKNLEGMTPRQIVDALGKYIMGQEAAKKAVAIAMRNRIRRRQITDEIREEIAPKNIIMIGPTGVGKTEIARRLAAMTGAPFLKVEATKYTEVGYVGRDVESMIRDLAASAVNLVKREHQEEVRRKAEAAAEEALLDLLYPLPPEPERAGLDERVQPDDGAPWEPPRDATREKLRKKLAAGELEEKSVELNVDGGNPGPMVDFFAASGMEGMDINIQEMLSNMMPHKSRVRRMPVAEARKVLIQQESEKLIDMDRITAEAVHRVEEMGIIFIDEIDKIAGRENRQGPDVSREGVQRDILPIIEGSTVNTRFGPVKTDHILFIAAGAFHVSKPSDLIPELQGRFPIRVELDSLTRSDFKSILIKPRNALLKQYQALLATEGISLVFDPAAVDEVARFAEEVNNRTENIGARRLHTLMEHLLEEISFTATESDAREVRITRAYVRERLSVLLEDRDVSNYIL